MSKVAIVTDSTAYIPKDIVTKFNLHIAPLILIWGEETFLDGIDIQPSEFYTRLNTAEIMPSTSQVTPATFEKTFKDLIDQEYQILALLISNELSGTIASAVQARDTIPNAPIEIIDSRTTAMSMGFQVLATAKAAQDGANLAECVAIAEQARQHTGVVFAVDTLEFLHRGGRIGGASRFLGTMLNFKPILEVSNGKVEAIERVRTRRKSLNRVLELVEERIAGRTPVRLASLHANAPQAANQLLDVATERFGPVEVIHSEVSPVIGTHIGPGTVGLAFIAGM